MTATSPERAQEFDHRKDPLRRAPKRTLSNKPGLIRPYRYFALSYRRTWRGSVTTTFIEPVLYLLAMGIGLGHLVNSHLSSRGQTGRLGGVGYVAFIAPGVIVATAMQTATNASMYPVMAGIKWLKTFHAMLATPVRVRDVLHGHLAWVATRVALGAASFLVVLACFGDVFSPLAVLVLPVSVLTGLAFAAPVTAFTVAQENDSGLSLLYRLGIVPLFLFSGTFFPISQLPGWLQLAARATPLYHAVALSRALVLGRLDVVPACGHLLYLVAMFALGLLLSRRGFERRLVV
ncbi:MAG: ABC transporter permease [Acidimicrobiales bacterium]